MAVERDGSKRLLIGDLVLDTGLRQVSRKDKPLDLPKLSYHLLLVLAEAAPNVVTQDELVERVWAGRVVSPETLTQRIKLTRKALGDHSSEPRYIGVVRGEGYRLLTPVSLLPAAPAVQLERALESSPEKRKWYLARATVIPLAIAAIFGLIYLLLWSVSDRARDDVSSGLGDDGKLLPIAVAVLPFVNASENPDDLYISEGLSDELRDQLGRIGAVRIAARSSSVQFRDPAMDAISIAGELRVSRLIEGQVRKQGDQLRVTVEIIDGATGYQVWTDSFNRPMQDLLRVQQEIVANVIGELLPERDLSKTLGRPASLVTSATDLMYLARHLYEEVRAQPIVDKDKLARVVRLYADAIEADPNSALAYSRLGAALLYKGDVEAAEEPIFRAAWIDPNLAEVQYTLGLYRWMRFLPDSGKAFQRAVELKPYDPDANDAYAKWIWHHLIIDQSEPYFRRALDMDPASLNRYADLGNFYGMSGMRDKALDVAAQISERFKDTSGFMVIARIHELAGDMDEAIAWALAAHDLSPENLEVGWMIAELYARIGDFERARQFDSSPAFNLLYWERRYDEMIDLGELLVIDQPDQVQLWNGLAWAYVATGRYDQAMRVFRLQQIPEHVFSENRRANGFEVLVTMADALNELGDTTRALTLASWMDEKLSSMVTTGGDNYWWPYLYSACLRSIEQQDELALEQLEKMVQVVGIPWYPLLVDSPCLRKYSAEPRYQAVVKAVDEQKRHFRERLPDTLRRFRAGK